MCITNKSFLFSGRPPEHHLGHLSDFCRFWLIGFCRFRTAICLSLCLNKPTKYRVLLRRWTNKDKASYETPLLQHTATHCNTLPHTATHCNTLQHTATHCDTLQHSATHCNTLQHTTRHCDTLQHTATHYSTLQHTVTHCNTLQHTAPHCKHCNTLQHTMTRHPMGLCHPTTHPINSSQICTELQTPIACLIS